MCHRLLGDLDADANQLESARQRYDEALRIVRGLSERAVLFEALFARGSLHARRGEVEAALSDLEEALGYCLAGGYRTYQADVRVGLAWAYRAAENVCAAREQAIEAERISIETEYYWGQIEAKEVLRTLA